ncbi:hypothetical protein EVAR_80427_1 [Eumeta japonica]|uniref:Uncharacterized protein n=1 Tax=Eumeta variegata TaxID=151549 RepID=A0A4C1VHL7_EUMVA|nr:hypothetical protein EVAR_80427_1 [Eumeta japonica]
MNNNRYVDFIFSNRNSQRKQGAVTCAAAGDVRRRVRSGRRRRGVCAPRAGRLTRGRRHRRDNCAFFSRGTKNVLERGEKLNGEERRFLTIKFLIQETKISQMVSIMKAEAVGRVPGRAARRVRVRPQQATASNLFR